MAANSPAMGFADRWRPVVAYDVKPVQASPVLMQLGRAICNRGHRLGPRPKNTLGKRRVNLLPVIQRFFGYWIADTLFSFLHGDKGHAFSVSRKALRLPGNSTAAGRFAAGSGVAALRSPRLRGRLVRVVRVKREWDQYEIAADLEQSRYFADGCYHVNSLFCLSRRFGSTE